MKKVDVWFEDEMRAGQRGNLSRIWAEKGTRPRVYRQQQHLNQYLFGAVCPQREEAVGLVLPYMDGPCLQLLLEEISKETKPERWALVVLDGAGGHRNQDIQIPDNVILLFLPPYSPELNPVENVWEFLRDHFFNNRVFDSLEEISEVCCEAWNAFVNEAGRIASLTSRSWSVL